MVGITNIAETTNDNHYVKFVGKALKMLDYIATTQSPQISRTTNILKMFT